MADSVPSRGGVVAGHGGVVAGHGGVRRLTEGGSFEDQAGYSRAVRHGRLIAVSGTTCRPEVIGLGTRAQAVDCLRRVVAAVERLGGSGSGIYRTRLFLAPGADWREASSAHLEVLGDVAPANTTLYVHSLIGAGLLVEAEAEALAAADEADPVAETGLMPETDRMPGAARQEEGPR